MDEVTGILIAIGAMFAGLLALSWACGDFHHPRSSSDGDAPPAGGQGKPSA